MRIAKRILAMTAVAPAAVVIAAAVPASAATPSCGKVCVDVFSRNFGTFGQPGFVMDVYKQQPRPGQPVILFRTSNSDPAEDFMVSNQGTVHDFYKAGLATSELNLHYGGGGCISGSGKKCVRFPNDQAYEIEYAPYGAASGLCVGVGSTAAAGTEAALEPCGAGPDTVWVADTLDGPLFKESVPLINGSDTNFSHPFVLTYPADGYPTDLPRPQMYTTQITGTTDGTGAPNLGTVDDNQLWSADTGMLS